MDNSCTKHTQFDPQCLTCMAAENDRLSAVYAKLRKRSKVLRQLLAERLPENLPRTTVENWDKYLDEWEDKVRVLVKHEH